MYLVKFFGIDNSYGFEPLIVDKRKQGTNMINFNIKNTEDEDLEFTLSDMYVAKATLPVQLLQTKRRQYTDEEVDCEQGFNNEKCYEPVRVFYITF